MSNREARNLRPELMAVGDSIYNGVRSLTIDKDLAALSVPAQVARAFGWSFTNPIYPREVLFDFEDIARHPASALRLRELAIDNATSWLHEPWASAAMFDNIAIAQMTVRDLWTFKYKWAVGFVEWYTNVLQSTPTLDQDKLLGLYFAINGSFVLNPSNSPVHPFADKSPLDIVAARRPKRLLVNIGVNDAIWAICLEAKFDEKNNIFSSGSLLASMKELGQRLLSLRKSGAVDLIYFNLLPKPSALANLMPQRDPDKPPPALGYYPEYRGRLGQIGGFDGDTLRKIDDDVLTLNGDIQAEFANLFAGTGGIFFMDLYEVTAARDAKHFRETAPPLWVHRPGHHDPRRLTNMPIKSLGPSLGGGLFGLDNLHPSTVGYAIIAEAVSSKIATTEGIPIINPIAPPYQGAYNSDTLLAHLPTLWDFENLLADLAVVFIGGDSATTIRLAGQSGGYQSRKDE